MKKYRWLWITYVWPEDQSSAAGVRTLELLRFLISNNQEIIVSSHAKNFDNAKNLKNLKDIKLQQIQLNDASFDEFVESLQPDIVVYDRFITEEQFGWRVRNKVPKSLQILDTQDLHFLRRTREKKSDDFFNEDFLREAASILRCDLTLLVSSFEEELLKQNFKISDDILLTIPISYKVSKKAKRGFSERKDFYWIGNFKHSPNVHGLKFFLNEVWPIIFSSNSSLKFHIYGAYIKKEFVKESLKNGVYVHGFLKEEDLEDTLSGFRVNIAPLSFGAGIKGKIAQGFSLGTPVVTTKIGAEGLCFSKKQDNSVQDILFGGIISNLDSPQNFAKDCLNLYFNEELWNEYHLKATHIVENFLDIEKLGKIFLEKVINLKENLDEHRKKNWLSSMLNLHEFKYHEYFSRWLELKNTLIKHDL